MTTIELAATAARAAAARKAEDITYLDLGGVASYCDGFLICTGTNRRHVRAIAEGVLDEMRRAGVRLVGVEGMDASRWVLIDLGDVLVHVFDAPMRGFYDLDALWADARRVPMPTAPVAAASQTSA